MQPEQYLAEFIAALEYADLSESTVDTIRRAFVDTVGVTLAGTIEGAGATVAASIRKVTDGDDFTELLGITSDEDPAAAALRVGTASHALDYDDLSWALDGHPSVTLVPPLMALAEETGADGRDLVTAYAAGFEVECAIADPISPAHYEAGWHATSTFGTFGAAAAAAHLLDLDCEAIERTLNIAASMPAGTKRSFGSMTKPLHAGLCAQSGVTAALLAREGLTSGRTAISGEQGFWDLYDPTTGARDADTDEWDVDINGKWALEIEGIHVKTYPCCYFTHTSIAATQNLVEAGINTADIECIEVRAAGGAGDALTNPDPKTKLEAKFSMEHAVACAAVRNRVGLTEFKDNGINDPELIRVRKQVDFAVDESLPYDSHKATVRIVTTDDTHECRQENPPGTHDDPLSEEVFRAKFDECAGRAVTNDVATHLYDILSSLDEHDDIVDVLSKEK